ncbi:zinc ribbon domain-containing protein [Paenibacillus rhizophilus]|uniref:Uncharacterized protein n=1 Tax=Paenibacillus rhizophilus TaxID=1850366 RepID=A0A3N9P5G4_9BACL|nr:zinc ribbon domain-containing protein [Paenibacillus rhizophilus]RQW10660.1 hypothetical protein EH198_15520 [Paenibacillus rhizophilus]
MYCSRCGTNNFDYAVYCVNDGVELGTDLGEVSLQPADAQFCSACGAGMAKHAGYCIICGEEAGNEIMVRPAAVIGRRPGIAVGRKPAEAALAFDYKTSLIRGALGGIVAIVGVLLLCLLISYTLNKQVPDLMGQELPIQELMNQYGADSDFKLIGVPEAVMAVNLVHSRLLITGGDSDAAGGSVEIFAGLIALLIVPLAALVIGGYISARRYRLSDERAGLSVSLAIGLYYGLFLLAVSAFAGFSREISLDLFSSALSGRINYSFSSWEAFIFGWIFGFLFSWAGYRLYALIHNDRSGFFRKSAVEQAIRTAALGIFVLSILAVVIVGVKFGRQFPFRLILLIAPQLGTYFWNFAHLGTLHFGGDGEQMRYSILWGRDSEDGTGMPVSSDYLSMHFIDGYVYSGLILALIILIWVGIGFTRNRASNLNDLRSITVFSLAYGVVMAVIARISAFGFSVQGESLSDYWEGGTFFVGFRAVPIFFASFVISILLLLCCYYFVRQKQAGTN